MIRARTGQEQTGPTPWHPYGSVHSLWTMPIRPHTLSPAALVLASFGLLSLAACQTEEEPSVESDGELSVAPAAGVRTNLSAPPEAVSFLGQRLHPLAMDSATAAGRYAQLDSAMAASEADPDDADALIWLGRRYGYVGRYRDAIDAFTEGIGRHPDDPRFYRHRGHRYISVRELDRAIADLETAARMTSGEADRAEPDGMPNDAGVPRSTLQTNIWYHLGLARYLKHDFEGAVHAFRRGYEISPNDDMRVAMADWLWLALERLGRDAEARRLLAGISPDMEILENDAYLDRLLVYKGDLSPDSLMGGVEDADALDLATHGYGLGAWYLVHGDEIRARATFERVLETGYWPAFGYIAAEAEVATMDSMRVPGPEPTSRTMKPPGS